MIRIKPRRIGSGQKAIAGVVAAMLLFAMLFTIGTVYFVTANKAFQSQVNASDNKLVQLQQQQQESFSVYSLASSNGNWVMFYVNNTGASPIILVNWFVSNNNGTSLLKSNTAFSLGINVGSSTKPLISQTNTTVASGSCTSANPCTVKVVSRAGNVATTLFPPSNQPGAAGVMLSTTIQVNTGGTYPSTNGQVVTVIVNVYNNAQATAFSVAPSLTAPIVTGTATASCTASCSPATQNIAPGGFAVFTYSYTVNTGADWGTITIYGYASGLVNGATMKSSYAMSNTVQVGAPAASGGGGGGVLLSLFIFASPSPLTEGQTVTVKVTVFNYATSSATMVLPVLSKPTVTGTATIGSCVLCGGAAQTITAGGNVNFTYTYVVHTGGTGGTASFYGYAGGTISGNQVNSAYALSAPVQIGSLAGSFNGIGPLGLDYFHFYYTASQQHVQTLAGLIPVSDTYVAFYANITNNYDQPIKVLEYSYLQLVRIGSEINFFIAKSVSYSPSSTLTAYTDTSVTCPSDPNCIAINPGSSVQIAFASFKGSGNPWGSNTWDWGTSFPGGASSEADSVMVVIVYLLNGNVYAQAIPFQAVVICSGSC